MKKRIANWGNYPAVISDERSFSFREQLDELLRSGDTVIARGNGRCYGDASLNSATISTLKFDKIISFDKEQGMLETESGLTLDKILELIVPAGWFLPVTPGTKFITIGGAIASDVHGKNHHKEGSFSRYVEEMNVVTGAGEELVCSPSINPELFQATCGGMGLTGIITRARFRLKKIESSYIRQKQVKAKNLDELFELFDQYNDYTYSVAWIDCLIKGDDFGRSILILGEHASINDLPGNLRAEPLKLPANKQLDFPFNLPSWVVNSFTVKVFNALYYLKNFRREMDRVVSYEPFFYPLDAIGHWNRGYGSKGFVQYQFVLPLEQRDALKKILTRISDKGLGSFLAVLKVFGKQDDLISFPKEGYTLALDFPVRDGLFEFLDELDSIVLESGGRLYMSKDARMKPAMMEGGYPRLNEFKNIVRKYNPDSRFSSIQSRRLYLTEN